MLKITLKHKDWSVFGSATLIGKWAEAALANPDEDRKVLVVEIEETSFGYRSRNGGPEEIIIPEFMPSCLIKDILSLTQQHGVDVQVAIKEINETPEI